MSIDGFSSKLFFVEFLGETKKIMTFRPAHFNVFAFDKQCFIQIYDI